MEVCFSLSVPTYSIYSAKLVCRNTRFAFIGEVNRRILQNSAKIRLFAKPPDVLIPLYATLNLSLNLGITYD